MSQDHNIVVIVGMEECGNICWVWDFVGRNEKPDIALLAGRPLLICYPMLVKRIAWSVL